MRPSRKGACSRESFSTLADNPAVSPMMIEKIIVVDPTTAVPISTGLAVALNVLPAPSLSSSRRLAVAHCGVKPWSRSISAVIPGSVSMTDSS